MYQIYDFERCTFSTPPATFHGSLSDNDITNLFNYFYDRSILCPDNHEVDHQNRQLLHSFSAFWNTPITTKFSWESVESIDGQNRKIDSYDVIPHMTGSPLSALELCLGAPVMILRNFTTPSGFYPNGGRFIISAISQNRLQYPEFTMERYSGLSFVVSSS
ncbi:hypothetical protein TRICI_005807 [Trichomonascus ciferrii]|uniref:Uncharacterized protein n=1 Tax=Trichomonascus ciferrii TaxID=44093 RepID=A0A642UPS5_9ASCO|nr:hypothetical protein TRICI_005807 [Trichomonascus ciferrii]